MTGSWDRLGVGVDLSIHRWSDEFWADAPETDDDGEVQIKPLAPGGVRGPFSSIIAGVCGRSARGVPMIAPSLGSLKDVAFQIPSQRPVYASVKQSSVNSIPLSTVQGAAAARHHRKSSSHGFLYTLSHWPRMIAATLCPVPVRLAAVKNKGNVSSVGVN